MMTKTEKKIQNRIRFGGFKSGAELRRALKMLRAIQRARPGNESSQSKRRLHNALYPKRSSR